MTHNPVCMEMIMARGTRFPASRVFIGSILLLLLGGAWSVSASAQDAKLVIFAAASLKDALDEVNAAFRHEKG